MSSSSKLKVCADTKRTAATSLLKTLEESLNSQSDISEKKFARMWLKNLRGHPEIFPGGWYDPPPFGIEVLFGDSNNHERLDFVNLRPEKYWPKDDVLLNKEDGYAYLFASPVDKNTGLAGDFAINIYLGNNQKIIDHIKNSLELDKQIIDFIKVGMSFSEIFTFADKLIDKFGLRNNIISVTDPNHANIGHTIPFSYEDLSGLEVQVLKLATIHWTKLVELISKKRKFLNRVEKLKIQRNMAFTIEPALKVVDDDNIPMTMLHNTVLINEDGEKERLTFFDEIFKLVGMDYML